MFWILNNVHVTKREVERMQMGTTKKKGYRKEHEGGTYI